MRFDVITRLVLAVESAHIVSIFHRPASRTPGVPCDSCDNFLLLIAGRETRCVEGDALHLSSISGKIWVSCLRREIPSTTDSEVCGGFKTKWSEVSEEKRLDMDVWKSSRKNNRYESTRGPRTWLEKNSYRATERTTGDPVAKSQHPIAG